MLMLNPDDIRDLSPDLLDEEGNLRVMPAAYYKGTTVEERAMFGHRNGFYGLPTTELVEWIGAEIAGRPAIEIGAGHGTLGAALGIPATDSFQQGDPLIALMYEAARQPTVRYGAHVERLDALSAIAKYKPQVVVASWVTHKYSESRPWAGGNMWAVHEEDVLASVDTYIFIGNTQVHRNKSIWELPHRRYEPDFVFSRSANGSPDFVAVWNRVSLDTTTNERAIT